jgi:AcrR family transcriptional regulator
VSYEEMDAEIPPRPARQSRRDSRGELVDAALDIILANGVDALRIEDVCERVGVTKGSLYWHFNDREGLIREALLEQLYRMADELMATLSEAIDTSASRDEYLVRVLGAFIDPFDPAEVEGRWQRLEMLTISRRDEGLAAMMADVQRRQQRYMTDIMEKARVQGILRADVDPKAMAAALTAISLGSTNISLLGDDGPSPEAWMAFMLLMVEMLFPPA